MALLGGARMRRAPFNSNSRFTFRQTARRNVVPQDRHTIGEAPKTQIKTPAIVGADVRPLPFLRHWPSPLPPLGHLSLEDAQAITINPQAPPARGPLLQLVGELTTLLSARPHPSNAPRRPRPAPNGRSSKADRRSTYTSRDTREACCALASKLRESDDRRARRADIEPPAAPTLLQLSGGTPSTTPEEPQRPGPSECPSVRSSNSCFAVGRL